MNQEGNKRKCTYGKYNTKLGETSQTTDSKIIPTNPQDTSILSKYRKQQS